MPRADHDSVDLTNLPLRTSVGGDCHLHPGLLQEANAAMVYRFKEARTGQLKSSASDASKNYLIYDTPK